MIPYSLASPPPSMADRWQTISWDQAAERSIPSVIKGRPQHIGCAGGEDGQQDGNPPLGYVNATSRFVKMYHANRFITTK